MIFRDFHKALGQFDDPRFRRLFWLGLALTVALLFAVYAGFLWFIEATTHEPVEVPMVGEVTWVLDLLRLGSILFMIGLSIFLMVPVASAITSMLLDDIADAVEARHYPRLAPVPRPGLRQAVRDTAGYFALLLFANFMAVFLYLALPILMPVIFLGMNGALLGREYFHLVARRRLGRQGARELAARHRAEIWGAGVLMALPLSVPLVNLAVPVLGAVTFTHLFHRLAGTAVQPAGGPIR